MSEVSYRLENPEIESLAKKVIEKDVLGLGSIDVKDLQFVRVVGKDAKKYADIRKIGYPANLFTGKIFLISFYDIFEALPIEKKEIVVVHELMHIDTANDKIKKHDIEDFRDIIKTYGIDWEIK